MLTHMYSRVKSEDKCHECKNEIGEERPTTTLNTEKGMIRLCKSCGEKLKKNVARNSEGQLMLRRCARCSTIVAEDYQPCFVIENPEEQFWLCIPCDERMDKEIEEDEREKNHS